VLVVCIFSPYNDLQIVNFGDQVNHSGSLSKKISNFARNLNLKELSEMKESGLVPGISESRANPNNCTEEICHVINNVL